MTVSSSAIRGARSRNSRPDAPGVTSSARSSRSRAAIDHRRRSSRPPVVVRTPGCPCASARAACSPAVSVPMSAATSVAYSTVTAPGASSQRGQCLGDRLVGIGAIGDECLGDRDRRRAVTGADDLGVAGQRRHGRERGLLGKVRDQFELGVQSGLQPAVRLDQDRVVEDDRGVRLVGARDPVPWRAPTEAAIARPGRHTSAAVTGPAPPAVLHRRRRSASSRGSAAIVRPSAMAAARARHVPSPGSPAGAVPR